MKDCYSTCLNVSLLLWSLSLSSCTVLQYMYKSAPRLQCRHSAISLPKTSSSCKQASIYKACLCSTQLSMKFILLIKFYNLGTRHEKPVQYMQTTMVQTSMCVSVQSGQDLLDNMSSITGKPVFRVSQQV